MEDQSQNLNNGALKCAICSTIARDEVELSNHYHEQHKHVFFACYNCEKSFTKLEQLFLHIIQKHAINSPDMSRIAIYDNMQRNRGGIVRLGFLNGVDLKPEVKEPAPKRKKGANNLFGNQKCVVEGCKSNCKTPGVKLFRFPATDLHQRYLWVALVNKKSEDEDAWKAKPWHRICSLHFVGGNYSSNENDVNYIPTLFNDALEDGPNFQVPNAPDAGDAGDARDAPDAEDAPDNQAHETCDVGIQCNIIDPNLTWIPNGKPIGHHLKIDLFSNTQYIG